MRTKISYQMVRHNFNDNLCIYANYIFEIVICMYQKIRANSKILIVQLNTSAINNRTRV